MKTAKQKMKMEIEDLYKKTKKKLDNKYPYLKKIKLPKVIISDELIEDGFVAYYFGKNRETVFCFSEMFGFKLYRMHIALHELAHHFRNCSGIFPKQGPTTWSRGRHDIHFKKIENYLNNLWGYEIRRKKGQKDPYIQTLYKNGRVSLKIFKRKDNYIHIALSKKW